MLTKTLHFDEDVLNVLRQMDWQNDGRLGILTGPLLERKLYEKVNKALETIGGKWIRKQGGHVFACDPRPQVEGLLESGALQVERDGFFETPDAVIDRMLNYVDLQPGDLVLEPSAGMGAIAKRLCVIVGQRGVICVEKNAKRAAALREMGFETYCCDFLDFEERADLVYRAVVMNPPFEEFQEIDHVQHAYELLTDGSQLVSIMSESPFFRKDKKAAAFRKWLDRVGGVSEELPDDSFAASGTGVQARIVAITKKG